MLEGSETPSHLSAETTDPKDALIKNIVDKAPEDQKRMTEYYLRHLPSHMQDAGMKPEEITQKLDEIGFPELLRPKFDTD